MNQMETLTQPRDLLLTQKKTSIVVQLIQKSYNRGYFPTIYYIFSHNTLLLLMNLNIIKINVTFLSIVSVKLVSSTRAIFLLCVTGLLVPMCTPQKGISHPYKPRVKFRKSPVNHYILKNLRMK